MQKRISQGLKVLQYYTTKKWVFRNDNLLKMEQNMCKDDLKKFNFNIDEVRNAVSNQLIKHNNC